MLDAPRRGCLNIHASLLPRWRGAAPIQAAVLAGDAESGVTIMQMEAGLDTGPMLLREAVPIGPRDDAGQPARRVGGARRAADPARAGRGAGAGAAAGGGRDLRAKLTRADGRLDWAPARAELDRRVRGLCPGPALGPSCGARR